MGSVERALGSSGSLGFAWVLSGAPRGRRVHWVTCRFTLVHIGVVGSFVFASVHSCAPRDSRVYSGSRRFTRARLGVVGYILFRVVSHGRA